MSNIVITKLEKRELLAMLFFGLWFVLCVILCLLLSNIVITILGKRMLVTRPFFDALCGLCVILCLLLSKIVITILGKRKLVALCFIALWLLFCLSWFVCSSSWCHW